MWAHSTRCSNELKVRYKEEFWLLALAVRWKVVLLVGLRNAGEDQAFAS